MFMEIEGSWIFLSRSRRPISMNSDLDGFRQRGLKVGRKYSRLGTQMLQTTDTKKSYPKDYQAWPEENIVRHWTTNPNLEISEEHKKEVRHKLEAISFNLTIQETKRKRMFSGSISRKRAVIETTSHNSILTSEESMWWSSFISVSYTSNDQRKEWILLSCCCVIVRWSLGTTSNFRIYSTQCK